MPKRWNPIKLASTIVLGISLAYGIRFGINCFTRLDAPSPLARWPIPGAKSEGIRTGVTHWFATDPADGTTVDFFDFDFQTNPKLRWEIADQDADDDKPRDNRVYFWPRDAAVMTRQLNAQKKGPVLAAWNGAFFGYDRKNPGYAFHLAPVVLNGKVLYNTSNHRWTFGVKYTGDGPQWKVFFKPGRPLLAKEFDWAAGSVQCLVKEGQPLKLEPFPKAWQGFKRQPVPSTPEEAGHIPGFDHMRSTRASIGWSEDSQHLYLLYIKEPDTEGGSIRDVAEHRLNTGGWMVSDLQRFWLSQGAWCAINSDAGDAGQLAFRSTGGSYTYLPPRTVSEKLRINLDKNLTGAPKTGGALMYFFVRESA